jgi:hypothetical protein
MVISCMAIQDTCFTSTSGRLEKCTRRLQFSTIRTKWTEIWLWDSDHITSRSYYISLYWIIYCYLNMTCLIYDDTLFHLVLACVCNGWNTSTSKDAELSCIMQVKLFGSEIEARGGVSPPGIKEDRLGGESNWNAILWQSWKKSTSRGGLGIHSRHEIVAFCSKHLKVSSDVAVLSAVEKQHMPWHFWRHGARWLAGRGDRLFMMYR